MKLHYYPGNASMAPHILLEEAGAPFELVFVDRTRQAHKTPAYLKLNPNGLIPVLEDGDLVLYEAAAIMLHIADKYPQARLAPATGTPERSQLYKWLSWLSSTVQPALNLYFYPERWVEEGNTAAAAQIKASGERKVGDMLDQLDTQLAHGKDWLLGEHYSVVDPYAMLLCRWTRNFQRPARNLPRLGPYLQRVLARPAVKKVFEKEKPPLPYV